MARKRTKVQREQELAAHKFATLASSITTVLTELIKWGVVALLGYYAMRAVEALAGKSTNADIGISFFGTVEVSVTVAWIFGIGGIIYGARQRHLRKNTVERLAERNRTLELQIDPKRSTSGLTLRGDTRPEDIK
jgi:hypothetical protein